ncbi:DUF1002 domain-containing protein [Falseniella ignava]|uniref:DUF1002 domain-containing protein n=1 Tax=Falseniella ignava CCUG 37419 TaxID=883112 RepID=K1LB94_9LACT|nr:DUF1002 domain-containing protein [Falseniella ignava]EKB53795.1 hypothetical protein HMPREF9707_01548 [Falseniella ignava CCUG 37419]
MKKRMIFTALAAAIVINPIALNPMPLNQVMAVQQNEQQELVALGASLDPASAQQTLALLGAQQVPQSNILYVNGDMINRYLQDGSNASTQVLSSAYIQQMPEGYGVQVQIVTPQNITVVRPLTYQNAAITAGARNVNIRIATVAPVTGEGALTGVYALLEQQGQAVNTHDVQVAQSEINLVNQIEQEATVSNEVANNAVADIKTQIVQATQEQQMSGNQINAEGDVTLTQEQITNIVNNIINEYQITNQVVIEQLNVYAQDFSKTEAAQNADTIQQLEMSMTEDWKDILPNLNKGLTADEILSEERLDFNDKTQYHPILQKFAEAFYDRVGQGELINDIYSDTFIYELIVDAVPTQEKEALNQLRTKMYQYQAGQLDEVMAENEMTTGYGSVKEAWEAQLQTVEDLNMMDPVQSEIIRRLAIATGRAPQVYDFMNPTQSDSVITYESSQSVTGEFNADFTMLTYDLMSSEITQLNAVSGVFEAVTPNYLAEKYQVAMNETYQPHIDIPQDYLIPGYMPVTEESNEMTEQEIVDENPDAATESAEQSEAEMSEESQADEDIE